MAVKILVVDDEAHITCVLCFKLRQAGAEVVSGSNGLEGLALAAEFKPDVIVTDFQMPEMDGLEFCRALAAEEGLRETPVLLLTARGHRVGPSDLAETSVRALLPKPFSIRDLLHHIGEILPGCGLAARPDAAAL
jgi:CheY-like chemotaxis protein